MQQVENFNSPTTTQNDAFKSVSKYFDRITRPEQILSSLPQAIQVMLDPAECGPATISMSQDVQGEAYDYPEVFFEEKFMKLDAYTLIQDKLRVLLKRLCNLNNQ